MAKKKKDQIDHIPKCYQQRRTSGGSKPRTDFSPFICSSNSPLPQDLLLESLSSKEILSSVTIASSDEAYDTRRDTVDHGYAELESRRQELFMDCIQFPVTEVKSFDQNLPSIPCCDRNNEETSDSVRRMEFTPDKSQIAVDTDICITPGSVVWTKTAEKRWWPAEALHDNEHVSSGKELLDSPDGPNCLTQHDQSPEKENSSSSSRAGTDYSGRERSKRERKRKVHFDEVSFPLKSVRKVRRFRIMRILGLAAPVGSPFQ